MTDSTRPVFFKMDNVIQNFPWGSVTSIHKLFGTANPDGLHQAEIWMGAHASGCSTIAVLGKQVLLSHFIAADPDAVLGTSTQAMFGELPYLFKVLAAENALSIQVHPSKKDAEIGFAKEEVAGIPYNAPNRNYKDPNHKPELVFALTPYQAMNGFREIKDIVAQFEALNIVILVDIVKVLSRQQNEQGLQTFFQGILCLRGEAKKVAINELLTYADNHQEDELFALTLELAAQYPGDIGLFAPLMLNVLTLQPGEAMFLDACTPHAYIQGTALEIMANSDNVLRAGLTPKYIDVPELVANTRFVTKPVASLLLDPEQGEDCLHYIVPVADFKFSVYQQTSDTPINNRGAEVLFAVDASLTVKHENGETITIAKGESVFIPAYAQHYSATCNGCFARAYN